MHHGAEVHHGKGQDEDPPETQIRVRGEANETMRAYADHLGLNSYTETVNRLLEEIGPPDPIGEAKRDFASVVADELDGTLGPAVHLFANALQNAADSGQADEMVSEVQDLLARSSRGDLGEDEDGGGSP
jgi:hypothetical protein